MNYVQTFESFLNEANWKETRGAVEFKIAGTTYTLYKEKADGTRELYKFDEDTGPMILRFKIEGDKMIYLYGGFDMDPTSRIHTDEIIESLFEYFGIKSDGKGIKSKNIKFEN